MRKLELSWEELRDMLQKADKIAVNGDDNPLEEIKEITLMKPRRIRIYLERS